MAPGIVLIIIGGILTLALKAESSWIDLRVVGLMFILGGLLFIGRSFLKRREVTTVADDGGVEDGTTVVERRVE